MNKVLIAYFSRKGNNYVSGKIVKLTVGNTEIAAKKIQTYTGGDLFEIQPVHPYSEDYDRCTEEAKQELQENARPKLTSYISDMNQYDVIYLGYPNWWGTMPMAVFTFLDDYDFSGKAIVPFCTHEGSGMGKSESDIKKLCSNATVIPGLAIYGSKVDHADETIIDWVKENVEKM